MRMSGTARRVTLGAHARAPPRPADRDRRLVPASGGPGVAHAHRRARASPRARRRRTTTSSTRSARRLHLVPRYRQRLVFPPADTGRPLWVDDTDFNLEYHVRHTALPAPGSRRAAARTSSRGSSPSSSTAPSRCGRCGSSRASTTAASALISKTHHAMIDGIAGVDLGDGPVRPRARADAGRRRRSTPWAPEPRRRAPSTCCARGARGHGEGRRSRSPRRRSARCARPSARSSDAREAAEGVGEIVWAGAEPGADDAAERRDRPAPALRRRRLRARGLQGRQERLRRDGQRRRARGRRRRAARRGCTRAACAPRASSCARSCRCRCASQDERGAGSATGSPRCAGRCRSTSTTRSSACGVVREAMDDLKESKQAIGAEVLVERAELRAADDPRAGLAAELLDAAVQPDRHERPRPAVPALRASGARCTTVFPIAFLPKDHALAIAIMSYNGQHELRPARRLRRAARPRRARRRRSRTRSPSSSTLAASARALSAGDRSADARRRRASRPGRARPRGCRPCRRRW